MKMSLQSVVCVALVVLTAGCVSTPASRIKKNPELFASFPADVQAQVKKGQVAVGYTKDMARLALGLPRRVDTRTTETGQMEIWSYMGARHISIYDPMDSGYWYRDRSGHMRRSYDTHWVDHGYIEEYPVLRLEFASDKIKAIEQMKR